MADGKPSGLTLRILSAAVLIPIALAAAWYGGWPLSLLVLLSGMLMLAEWERMIGCSPGLDLSLTLKLIVLVVAVLLAAGGLHGAAIAVLLAGAALTAGFALRSGQAWPWAAGGLLYIGLPCVALIWLRERPDGLQLLIWVFGVVWAADTGAYCAGRSIGGPKLAPRLSPNKTWAGMIGGVLAAALFGALLMRWGGQASAPVAALSSGVLAIVAELGDLAESAAKRRFGVKDAGNIIPGHGGVLDRLDSMLFAAPAAVLLLSVVQGGRFWQ